MSFISPQKRLFQQFTPSKVTVGYQINGWLQTHQKKQSFKQNKINKNRPPKPQCLNKCTFTNFQQLKKKIHNLHTSERINHTKKKINSIGSTKNSSPSSISNVSSSLKKRFQNLVKISSFEDHLKEIERVEKTKTPLIRLIQIKSQNTQNKQNKQKLINCNKTQQKSKRMTKMLSYLQIKKTKNNDNQLKLLTPLIKRKNIISQSIDIVREKLTANQYKALNMIARKSQNVQLKMI